MAIGGITGVFVFLLFFGVRILIGFSLFVDRIRGASPQTQQQNTLLLPPILDPLTEATFSATLTVSGHGQENTTLVLFVNEKEYKKLTVAKGGLFTIDNVTLTEGDNVISSRAIDEKGNASDLSNVLRVTNKRKNPLLVVTSPDDGSSVVGDNNSITIAGKTEEDTSITVNGRFVVVANDGSFDYKTTLQEAENTFTIVATDQAGNKTELKRRVTYNR